MMKIKLIANIWRNFFIFHLNRHIKIAEINNDDEYFTFVIDLIKLFQQFKANIILKNS